MGSPWALMELCPKIVHLFNILYLSIYMSLFNNYFFFLLLMGIGDWGLGPIPNPQSPIPNKLKVYRKFFITYK